jgi:hypothetical protein
VYTCHNDLIQGFKYGTLSYLDIIQWECDRVLTRKFYSFRSYLGSITSTNIIHVKSCFKLSTLILCVNLYAILKKMKYLQGHLVIGHFNWISSTFVYICHNDLIQGFKYGTLSYLDIIQCCSLYVLKTFKSEWKVESNKTSRFVKAITFQARKCNYASRWVNYSHSLQH